MTYSLLLSKNGYPPEDSDDNWIIARFFDEAAEILISHPKPEQVIMEQDFPHVVDITNFLNTYLEKKEK